ncbi:MAG: tetratricopeptide repeat protein, partial [Dokdonella sp.]|uniref:tetratricopeptide repeat protein n=1 Tax=Dokdonella sp. TaxID=2291710 RepID=UPI003F7D36F0
ALGVVAAWLLPPAAGLAGRLLLAREARVQQALAEGEAARALAEAGTANAVRDVLVGVFAAANPEETGGRAATALDLADAGLRRVDAELSEQPRLQASLLAALGAAYGGLGQSERAIETLRRARERAVQADGEDSPAATRATVDLAAAIAAHPNADTPRRRDEIAPLLEAIVARERPGVDAALRVGALTQYGVVLQARGDAIGAQEALLRAVAAGRAAGDAAAARTADALLALHDLLAQQGRVSDAIGHLREALAIRIMTDGAQGAATLAIKTNLGFLLGEAGSLDEAADLLAQVLDARRAIYGEHHPRYAHALIALASIRERQDRAADAEPMLDEALAIARAALGADSELALSALNSLAGVRTALHDPQGGIIRSREAVAMAARMYGEDQALTLRLRDNLAGIEAMNGDYAAAETDARRIIVAHDRAGSGDAGYARFWLGHVLRLRGDAAAAKAAHEQALAALLELEGPDSNFALAVRAELAEDERDLGDFDAARAEVDRARADAARIAPGVDDSTARTLRYLAAQLDLLQGRADAGTAAELDRVFARASEREQTPMARWQTAGAGLFAGLCRQRLGIGHVAEAQAQIRASGEVLRASPLADPFLRRLAAQASREVRRASAPVRP